MADSLPGRSALGGAGRPINRAEWRERVKEREALDLWVQGRSYVQIKNALNLRDQEAAMELVVRGQERWEVEELPHLARYKAAQLSDLMEIRTTMMEALRGGDQYAADRAMKAWERLSKLLGLDAQREASGGLSVHIEGVGRFDAPVTVEGEWSEVKALERGPDEAPS